MDAGYYTHRSRSTRAASAHHTEASGRREPFSRQWYKDEPDAFQVGDTVEVVDAQSIHYRQQGIVRLRMTPKKFGVKFAWNAAAIFPFKSHQLRKIEPKVETTPLLLAEYSSVISWDKRDLLQIEWGVCRLDKHPDIPERWAARHIPSEGVIIAPPPPVVALLPERCATTIAHDQFQKFMGLLRLMDALDELPITEQQEPLGILDTIMAQEDAKAALKCHSLPKKRVLTPRKPKTRETIKRAPKRAMPPKLKIRSYAA